MPISPVLLWKETKTINHDSTFCFLSPVSAGEKNQQNTTCRMGPPPYVTTGTPQTWKKSKKHLPESTTDSFVQPQGFSKKLNRHLHSLAIPSIQKCTWVPPSRPTWAGRSMLQKIVRSLATWGPPGGEEQSRIFQQI